MNNVLIGTLNSRGKILMVLESGGMASGKRLCVAEQDNLL